jgi:hypothetical protein
MTTSTPLTALSAGLRALRRRRSRTRRVTTVRRTARATAKDLSRFPVCGHFPATAPARVAIPITERHR